MKKIRYNKPALNVDEQINLLQKRGLIIQDIDYAKNILNNITYYRLSSYMKFFQTKDVYKKETTFEDIINLYNFDKDLKSIIFENIRIIEISLRTKICLHMCSNYGSHWFYDIDNYKSQPDYKKTLEILQTEKELKKDTFIKYYLAKYSKPNLPPFWMMTEVLSMGDLSKILNSLKYKDIKQIANNFNTGYYISPVLTNWIHVLATIRNICAHHSRLWNRQLRIKLTKPQKIPEWYANNIKPDNIFAVCFVIALLMKNNPYNNFEHQLTNLFHKYKNIDYNQMGFSNDWILI